MAKCSWLITKGSKKGTKCGIYTTKKYDGKHYCASHYKMISVLNEPEEKEEDEIEIYESEDESPVKKVKKPVKNMKNDTKKNKKIIEHYTDDENLDSKESPEVKPNLKSHSVDDIIDYEFDQIIKKEKSKTNIDHLTDKVNYLTDRFNKIFPPDFEKQMSRCRTNLVSEGAGKPALRDRVKSKPSYENEDIPKLESWKK